jgi:hypothetical protein
MPAGSSASPLLPAQRWFFSFVGYASQEVAVGSQTTYNITMKVQTSSLNDVVVIGYGTRLKKDVTGAVSTIDAGDHTKKYRADT